MNAVESLLYRHIPSFKREHGGLHSLYVAIYSRAYAARARSRHRRGRHGPAMYGNERCQWCGQSASR